MTGKIWKHAENDLLLTFYASGMTIGPILWCTNVIFSISHNYLLNNKKETQYGKYPGWEKQAVRNSLAKNMSLEFYHIGTAFHYMRWLIEKLDAILTTGNITAGKGMFIVSKENGKRKRKCLKFVQS